MFDLLDLMNGSEQEHSGQNCRVRPQEVGFHAIARNRFLAKVWAEHNTEQDD